MPPKAFYETPEDMEKAIEAYFQACDDGIDVEQLSRKGKKVKIRERQPYTMEGMAVALGFASRRAFYRYKEKDPENEEDENRVSFGDTIARARLRVKAHRLSQALLGHQESKVAQLDLAVNFGMQPKLQLPEGAQIIIGYTKAPPGIEDDQPLDQAKLKPEQITE